LIGNWRALFALLAGTARLRSGQVLISGLDAGRAVADGIAAVAPLDAPLPREWTAERYLETGARLAGFSRKETRDQIRSVLGTLACAHLSSRRISTLTLAEQRALSIAQALLGNPSVLAVEDPFIRLDERGTALIEQVVECAAQGRALVISASHAAVSGPCRAILDLADSVLVLESGTVVAQGSTQDVLIADPRYLVSVTKNGAQFVERLEKLGLSVQASLDGAANASRFLVRLPNANATRTILDAALEAEAPVLELRPFSLGTSPPDTA
jgi:ABC-type multidrug transport system ATPase subunit